MPLIDPGTGQPYTFPIEDGDTGKPLPRPSRPINYGVKSNVISVKFDSGHEQRRIRSAPIRTFDFTYIILKESEYKTIRDFYFKVVNCYSFYWTDPIDEIRYEVKFNMDTFVGNQKYHSLSGPCYELQIKLEQVL